MNISQLLDKLWYDYISITPSAEKIKHIFNNLGNNISNDHIAFRTYDDPRVNIDVMATVLLKLGYIYKNDYYFPKKKLYAKHYEHSTDASLPLVFISQLITSKFSKETQEIITAAIDTIDFKTNPNNTLLYAGRLWNTPSYKVYRALLEESEYAAWVYVNGFCANHFTINVNKLTTFKNLEDVNTFLKENNLQLNTSGGEIKGTPAQFLQQSSIVADKVIVNFTEGSKEITSCYYEFAYRYKKDGQMFRGFIADSADKIFESTYMVL